MRTRAVSLTETGPPAEELAEVVLEDPEGCPRYSARIFRGIKIGPSPEWAQRRLEQCGMRPISNVVDATNLAMMELGQPLHAFDYKLLKGKPTIIVRRAKPGEKMVTIDGEARTLDPEILVIADPSGAVAIAGVMGGSSSEINDATTDVLVESAHFNPSGRAQRRAGPADEHGGVLSHGAHGRPRRHGAGAGPRRRTDRRVQPHPGGDCGGRAGRVSEADCGGRGDTTPRARERARSGRI